MGGAEGSHTAARAAAAPKQRSLFTGLPGLLWGECQTGLPGADP